MTDKIITTIEVVCYILLLTLYIVEIEEDRYESLECIIALSLLAILFILQIK